MGPGEAITAVAFFGMLIGVAIAASAMFRRHLEFKERELELTAANAAGLVEQLEERMRVLERIATDRGVDLAHQIEALREPATTEPAHKELSR